MQGCVSARMITSTWSRIFLSLLEYDAYISFPMECIISFEMECIIYPSIRPCMSAFILLWRGRYRRRAYVVFFITLILPTLIRLFLVYTHTAWRTMSKVLLSCHERNCARQTGGCSLDLCTTRSPRELQNDDVNVLKLTDSVTPLCYLSWWHLWCVGVERDSEGTQLFFISLNASYSEKLYKLVDPWMYPCTPM